MRRSTCPLSLRPDRPRNDCPAQPDGSARQAADGIAFPNGMAVTPDNLTLIVAESYGKKLTAFEITADGSHVRLVTPTGPPPVF